MTGLKSQIETAQRNLREWPEWMKDSTLTVKGAMLLAGATKDTEGDLHRHALTILAEEVKRLAKIEKMYRQMLRQQSGGCCGPPRKRATHQPPVEP